MWYVLESSVCCFESNDSHSILCFSLIIAEAIEADSQAFAKDTIYTFTFVDDLITKLEVVGFDPISIYEELIAPAVPDSSSAPDSSSSYAV